jgi:HAD superfamily hydrolase (TIGR01509 family)
MQTSDDVDLTRITTVLLGADGTLFPSEDRADSASLARALRPHPEVLATLAELRQRYQLAVVTASALSRLEACFTASGLDEILPAALRFSAEDSLPVPDGRPNPAVYQYAAQQLGIAPTGALVVEDSVAAVKSAVAAGIATVGMSQFVPLEERADRVRGLSHAGAAAVVDTWTDLASLLSRRRIAALPKRATPPR